MTVLPLILALAGRHVAPPAPSLHAHRRAAHQASVPGVSIIPRPISVAAGTGSGFEITSNTVIVAPSGLLASHFLHDLFLKGAGLNLPIRRRAPKSATGVIAFVHIGAGSLPAEGYTLHAGSDGIKITYSKNGGALYGFESLHQLLPTSLDGSQPVAQTSWTVPAVDIQDAPRFPWRGMMLDVSRHFYQVPFIKQYLDFLAMNKMNVFHWHLVDDGGWRIQIDGYPKLTEVGAYRYGITTGWDQSKLRFDSASGLEQYGGFYTKAQIRDVVRYAADRNITIVPEIEMPGHSMAAVASYPDLGCLDVPPSSQPGQPASNVYCAGNPETYKFLETVLTEVMQLFPSKWIHIGGDEVDKRYWHGCPRCQALIKEKGLANEEALQSYFVQHFDKFLASHGRRLIGWDEILEGGLAPGATVMSWRGIDGGIAAAKAGHDVVMSPTSHCYFDYSYESISTEHVYSYEPIPSELSEVEGRHVLGGQANEWTEWIPTTQRAEFMIFPRIFAMAEVLWSPKESKDFKDFSARLQVQIPRLDALGITYHVDVPASTTGVLVKPGSSARTSTARIGKVSSNG